MKHLFDTITFFAFLISQIFHFMPEIAAAVTAMYYGLRTYQIIREMRAKKPS